MRGRGATLSAAGVLIVALAAGTGYHLGRHHTEGIIWHTGDAWIGDHEASITTPGWTYGFMTSVPRWIDADGTTHTDSWPDCVNPLGTQKPVTFATVNVTGPGGTWRQVVYVDCRHG
jgi:hypothetical protein